jgi:phosphohistidine phosphatase SixA
MPAQSRQLLDPGLTERERIALKLFYTYATVSLGCRGQDQYDCSDLRAVAPWRVAHANADDADFICMARKTNRPSAGNKSGASRVRLGWDSCRRLSSVQNTSTPAHLTLKEQKMITLSRRNVVALAAFLGVLFAGATQASAVSDRDLAQALRAGGLVIVVRHGATFPDQADTDPLNFDNVAAQRNLNDKGKELARQFGEALRGAGVPVGEVYTSKYNRAYETAVLAGFKDIEKTADLAEGGLIVSPNENNRRAAALRKMLAAAPRPGTNTILITHYPNIIAALGKDWFDVKEGEASIFRPQDGAYVLVARVQMDEWPRIADTVK